MKSSIQLNALCGKTIGRPLGALTLCSMLLFSSQTVHADPLASYDMDNGTTPTLRISPSLVGAGVTATMITSNSLANFGVVTKPSGVDSYTTWITTVGGGTTVTDAIAAAQYLSFTVAPVSGNSLTLSSLSFDIFAATGTTTSYRQIYVFSDQTGFATGNEMLTGSTNPSYPTPFNLIPFNTVAAGENFSIDLSSLASVTESITFRIYFQTPTPNQGMALDDITVAGTVVPEPSALTFLGLGLVSLMTIKRYRRQD
jgi:hypothetical protein